MHPCRSWIRRLCSSWRHRLRRRPSSSTSGPMRKAWCIYSDQPRAGRREGVTSSAPGMPRTMPVRPPRGARQRRAAEAEADRTLVYGKSSRSPRPAPEQTFIGGEIGAGVAGGGAGDSSRAGHCRLALNGAQVQGQTPTPRVHAHGPGARQSTLIEATVTDAGTGESKTAEAVTFNVVSRPSLLSPQHK